MPEISGLIDIGVNLTDPQFDSDRPAVIERAQQAGISGMLLTATCRENWPQVIALARQYPRLMRTTAGVHPHHAGEWQDQHSTELAALLQLPEVVAVGETGLDFNRCFSTPAEQERAFEAHLALAAASGKPLFLHERDASVRMLALLRDWKDQLPGGVLHCFTGDRQSLFAYLDLGLHIGLTGWLCDERRGTHLWPLVSQIPADRLLLETDAPWLLPRNLQPKPKKRRNEPAFLPWVLQQLAQLRQEPVSQLARQTASNAQRLFGLPQDWLV